MRLLSKLPADVAPKSFQEVITFAGHPLWPSRPPVFFLRGFLHPWFPFLLVAGTGICGMDLIEYLATLILKFESAPSSHRGAKGRWRWLRLLVALLWRHTSYDVPLVLAQRQSIELPATTVGEWRRRLSLRRHKGGLRTVFLSPATTCCCRVAFNESLRNVQ